jgi:hypothetical protein
VGQLIKRRGSSDQTSTRSASLGVRSDRLVSGIQIRNGTLLAAQEAGTRSAHELCGMLCLPTTFTVHTQQTYKAMQVSVALMISISQALPLQ